MEAIFSVLCHLTVMSWVMAEMMAARSIFQLVEPYNPIGFSFHLSDIFFTLQSSALDVTRLIILVLLTDRSMNRTKKSSKSKAIFGAAQTLNSWMTPRWQHVLRAWKMTFGTATWTVYGMTCDPSVIVVAQAAGNNVCILIIEGANGAHYWLIPCFNRSVKGMVENGSRSLTADVSCSGNEFQEMLQKKKRQIRHRSKWKPKFLQRTRNRVKSPPSSKFYGSCWLCGENGGSCRILQERNPLVSWTFKGVDTMKGTQFQETAAVVVGEEDQGLTKYPLQTSIRSPNSHRCLVLSYRSTRQVGNERTLVGSGHV